MAKSSYALALFVAGWSAEAGAEPPAILPVTFDLAKVRHERFGPLVDTDCPETGRGSDEEIVVCGRTPHGPLHRLPLPIEREPGEIVRHHNEPGNAVQALSTGGCSRTCYQPVTIDVLQAARAMPKIIGHIFGHDD
jgi:hypothetical protein